MDVEKKIILDLCGGTGAWSNSYKEAGYDVRVITLPDHDVESYVLPGRQVYGILAAPPCTMFSQARTRAKEKRDLEQGMNTVKACLELIWKAQYDIIEGAQSTKLKFWAIENPFGFLKFFLGRPALIFQPYDFGDRYQKRTCLWGNFNLPEKSPVELEEEEKEKFAAHIQKLPDLPDLHYPLFGDGGYKMPPDMDRRQVKRSITPSGFAKAFFEANK